LIRRIIDRQNPDQQDWAAPMAPGLSQDYALIARAPEPETGQMLLIAGLGEKGSTAVLEFVANAKYLDCLASQARAGWEKRNIELFIKPNLLNEDWGKDSWQGYNPDATRSEAGRLPPPGPCQLPAIIGC
jgi:hypothetical protein